MTIQKPSIGRQVHYMSGIHGTSFDRFVRSNPRRDVDTMLVNGRFSGPYTATIVYVHYDDLVNLHVLFPEMLNGTDKSSEIVERVPYGSDDSRLHGYWFWPART